MTTSQEKYIKRLENFHWKRDGIRRCITDDGKYFEELNCLEESLLEKCRSGTDKELRLKSSENGKQLYTDDELFLKNLIEKVLKFTSRSRKNVEIDNAFVKIFSLNSPPANRTSEEAYIFTVLCNFLHNSTRVAAKSYADFLYDCDPHGYKDLNPEGYYSKQDMQSEAERLRKSRYRRLKQGRVFITRPKWAAVPDSLEHELKFRYELEKEDASLADTYKRFGNLYNDIRRAINDTENDRYEENLLKAEKSFLAKVKRLDYSNYLKLQQKIAEHLYSDPTYQGINLYRWERRMMPWRMIHDVNWLLSEEANASSEVEYLWRVSYLAEIPFPQLYKSILFSPIVNTGEIGVCANTFNWLLQEVNRDGCLVLDALVQEDILGENWQSTIRNLMNKLAPEVLYDPREIDFTVPEGDAQEKFEKLLSSSVEFECYDKTGNREFLSLDLD